jgi:hypothetical protein
MSCCGLLGIMFSIELVEGRDAQPEIQVLNVEHGKTMGLLLRMLTSYFYTGKYVILDLGFVF